MQRYTMVFIAINALHISGGFSAHHQELKTVYTGSGICRGFTASYCFLRWWWAEKPPETCRAFMAIYTIV